MAGKRPGSSRRVRRGAAGAVVTAVALVVLTGCASAGESTDTADGGSAASLTEPAPGAVSERGAGLSGSGQEAPGADTRGSGDAGEASSEAGGPRSTALHERRRIRSGQLTLQVADVDTAVTSVRAAVIAANGYVADEQTSTRPVEPWTGGDPTSATAVVVDRSVLTVRVPQETLDRVMGQVADVGTVRARSQASQDVTDSYVDATSRVKSQRASVDRVRDLLSRATGIGDVVRLESELSRREADLDALEARLAALRDSTTMATLTVTLTRPGSAEPMPTDHDGFVGGLRAGWDALGASAAVVLQIVGAALPFTVLLTVVGLPVWLVLRRRRTGSPTPSLSDE